MVANSRFESPTRTTDRPLFAVQRPTNEGLELGPSRTDVSLRCPTYLENSHANHTWHQQSRETASFKGSEAPSPWVRFPSPAPSIFHGVPERSREDDKALIPRYFTLLSHPVTSAGSHDFSVHESHPDLRRSTHQNSCISPLSDQVSQRIAATGEVAEFASPRFGWPYPRNQDPPCSHH